MGWTKIDWACGHSGEIQLYGKMADRESKAAFEAGRQCMACWLVDQWEQNSDPRAKREDRYKLAAQIAEGKSKRIKVADAVPLKNDKASLMAERDKLVARIAEIDAMIEEE